MENSSHWTLICIKTLIWMHIPLPFNYIGNHIKAYHNHHKHWVRGIYLESSVWTGWADVLFRASGWCSCNVCDLLTFCLLYHISWLIWVLHWDLLCRNPISWNTCGDRNRSRFTALNVLDMGGSIVKWVENVKSPTITWNTMFKVIVMFIANRTATQTYVYTVSHVPFNYNV